MTHRALLLPLPLLLLACAEEPARFVSDASPSPDGGAALDAGSPVARPDVPPAPDVGRLDVPVLDDVRVYAHTDSTLYAINPRTFSVTRVADFVFSDGGSQMTDLAINADGQAWGITFNALYRVDLATGRCTFLSPFAGAQFNGLSFIPGGELEPGETLVAANRNGAYVRVDQATGAIRQLGVYGADTGSSGDIVSVAGGGTFATIVDLTTGLDPVEYLARIDPMTGRATRIGPTGVTHTWGLGYWRSVVYGFTEGGAVVTLDINTGRATEVAHNDVSWWGAAVTTIAPVAPP